MEITDARQIEIFHTLEKIERMNKAIAFHKALENPDKLAIEQYRKLKNQLSKELVSLLSEMDLTIKLEAA